VFELFCTLFDTNFAPRNINPGRCSEQSYKPFKDGKEVNNEDVLEAFAYHRFLLAHGSLQDGTTDK
jgi:hypothetical protein